MKSCDQEVDREEAFSMMTLEFEFQPLTVGLLVHFIRQGLDALDQPGFGQTTKFLVQAGALGRRKPEKNAA